MYTNFYNSLEINVVSFFFKSYNENLFFVNFLKRNEIFCVDFLKRSLFVKRIRILRNGGFSWLSHLTFFSLFFLDDLAKVIGVVWPTTTNITINMRKNWQVNKYYRVRYKRIFSGLGVNNTFFSKRYFNIYTIYK